MNRYQDYRVRRYTAAGHTEFNVRITRDVSGMFYYAGGTRGHDDPDSALRACFRGEVIAYCRVGGTAIWPINNPAR